MSKCNTCKLKSTCWRPKMINDQWKQYYLPFTTIALLLQISVAKLRHLQERKKIFRKRWMRLRISWAGEKIWKGTSGNTLNSDVYQRLCQRKRQWRESQRQKRANAILSNPGIQSPSFQRISQQSSGTDVRFSPDEFTLHSSRNQTLLSKYMKKVTRCNHLCSLSL